jgi:Na+-driven multidrug efflux pump
VTHGLRFVPDASALAGLAALLAPTGFLVLRTASITVVYAAATALAARAGPEAAAAHQVCFQLWLASSLLADSLAVACQTLLARSAAAKDADTAREVRCCSKQAST